MQELVINYDTGCMRINVEAFFPCVRSKSRILFPLIAKWCSPETILELLAELKELKEGYGAVVKMNREAAEQGQRDLETLEAEAAGAFEKDQRRAARDAVRWKKADIRRWKAQENRAILLRDRMARNIAALRKEARLGEWMEE